jgi:two-component SAPR family response regulator
LLEHILVVEDDEFMRMSLEAELQLAGYRVSLAENGLEAVELAKQQHFDLVISDIRMPGMDGLETLSALREFQPEARNIVITGYADPEAPITAVKLKVDDYLMKPFTSEEFLKSVRASLEAQLQELRKRRSVQKLREVMLISLQQQSLPEHGALSEAAAARVMRLSRQLGLSAARTQSLQLAAWLRGLDEQVEAVEELKSLAPVLQHSLESWDGSGPKGLVGQQIPLEGRVLRAALERHPTDGICDPELLALLASEDENDGERHAPAALEARTAPTLLSVAQSYLDSGHLDIAAEALEQTAHRLVDEPDSETQVAYWLLRAELMERKDDLEAALEAARQAFALADRSGLELHRARASLLAARLGCPVQADLERARQTFQLFEANQGLVEADLWLTQVGAEGALSRLLVGLSQAPDFFLRLQERLSDVLKQALSDPGLAAAIAQAGDRALPILEQWLRPDAPVDQQLKAIDLLASIDTPAARTLLGRVGSDSQGALSHKSKLLMQKAGQTTTAADLQLHLLGYFHLSVNGRPLEEDGLATKKTRNLLAFLASRRGQEVDEEVLIDVFWEHAGPKAKHSLHNAISQIRKALKPILGENATVVAKRRQGYVLEDHPRLWIDIDQFQKHSDEAHRLASMNRSGDAAIELKKAEAIYRGDFMEGTYEDWTEPIRTRLLNQLTQLLTALARHFFERSKYEVSLDYWKRLLQRDNCSEDAYLGIMLCQSAQGRQSEAVRTYHQCARKLREELNLSPPPRIVETYLKMLQ